jgi:hypothetical protein
MYYIDINDLREKKTSNKRHLPNPLKNLTMAAVPNNHPHNSIILWHQRLHLSNDYIKRLFQLKLVIGLLINAYDMKRQLSMCEACMYAKFTRNSFFKKFVHEKRERYKIAKKDQKAFNDMKDKLPFSSASTKYNKYPDEPISEFCDTYSREDDMEIEDVKSKFIKTKHNGLQNNLVGNLEKITPIPLGLERRAYRSAGVKNHYRKNFSTSPKNRKIDFLVAWNDETNKQRIEYRNKFNESKNNREEMRINASKFLEEIQSNKNTCQNIFEISVKDYLNLSKSKKAKLKGYKVPVEFPEKEVPFDPYMVGYWLGDGTGRSSEIASQDSTVLHYFRTNLPKHNLYLSHRSKYSYGITGDGKYHNNIFLNTLK